MFLAEREGFEPSVRASVHLISSQAHSASLAPLRGEDSTTSQEGKPKAKVFQANCMDIETVQQGHDALPGGEG